MQTKHADIASLMADHLHQAQRAFSEIDQLRSQVNTLTAEVNMLKKSGGDQGWMSIKKAADLVGISTDALAQRFRRGAYPEGVVWSLNNGRYSVNLRALREHMARVNIRAV